MSPSTVDKPQGIGKPGTIQVRNKPISANKLDKFILIQVAWCTFPALILVRLGALQPGSIWCFVFLLAFLGWYALKRNMPAFGALLIGVLPALSYTRGHFFYNSVVALLGLSLALWYVRSPKECSQLWDNQLIRWFLVAGTVYWLISVWLTGQYHANLMVIEMLCSAGSIYLLGRYPKYLGTALAGLSISTFAVAMGVIGHGERLGVSEIEGERVGNNQAIGFPAALVVLLAMADNGKWLYLQNSKIIKYVLIAMCGAFLLLSTSRGSWIVALAGIGVAVFYQSHNRRRIVFALLLAACVLMGVLQTKSGDKVAEYFEKLTDSDRTLSEKTTGRYEMWLLFPEIFKDHPIGGVGPGLGKKAYADYSWVDRVVTYRQGKEIAWHALYLQVGVETGMIGLIVLAFLLGRLMFKAFLYRKLTGHVIPLIGIVGFMTIGISVPGFSGLSGFFLGLAFLGTIPPPHNTDRKMPQPARTIK